MSVTSGEVLERLWFEATDSESASARVRALELLGRHFDMFGDGEGDTGHMKYANLTDDQLDKALKEESMSDVQRRVN